AEHQLSLIRAEADRRGVTIHVIIDIIHVLELSTVPARDSRVLAGHVVVAIDVTMLRRCRLSPVVEATSRSRHGHLGNGRPGLGLQAAARRRQVPVQSRFVRFLQSRRSRSIAQTGCDQAWQAVSHGPRSFSLLKPRR
ncbi:MAG: hypothetical protein ACRDOE_21275, partial [Streptosporangiaceae bacterium]